MKQIKWYELVSRNDNAGFDISRAVRDIMALFQVRPLADSIKDLALAAEDVVVQPPQPAEILLVDCLVKVDGVKVLVKTKICSRADTAVCQERESSTFCEREDIVTALRRLVKLNILRSMHELTGQYTGPWGILHGVRPTKIVHRLLDRKQSEADIIKHLQRDYDIQIEKARLLTDIAVRQHPFLSKPGDETRLVSIYIGVPYCASRCLYCSFISQVLPDSHTQISSYLAAAGKDMAAASRSLLQHGLKVQSIYIGGGTPTSLAADDFAWLVGQAKKLFVSAATREFTVEAGRPDSLNDEKIAILGQMGVSRVSINPQTMQQNTLKHIGRKHTVQDIINTFGKIRRAGVPVINMDIIAGLPGEAEEQMKDTMEQILPLQPDNLTVHTLALKRGSELMTNREHYHLPNQQQTVNMLAIAADYAAQMRMVPYYLYRQKYMTGNLENVGYCRPATECLYNMNIMEERQTIIGIGPGAGTKAVNTANWSLQSSYNAKDVATYINHLEVYLAERDRLLASLYGNHREE